LRRMPVDSGSASFIIFPPAAENQTFIPAVKTETVRKEDGISIKNNYPEGEFKINETRVVYVRKGISFLAIAKQFDIALSRIFEFNEIQQEEETKFDQLIYLQRKRKTGLNDFHIVQPGETLHDIAQSEAIRLENLQELNWLKMDEMPVAGEKLSLKTRSPGMPKLALKENYSIMPVLKPGKLN
ncbi:MAG: LysM peptidoglycan-binding domain-containing protein, partial [Chitinophagaceae bacterium]